MGDGSMRAWLVEAGNTVDGVGVESASTYGGWTTIWLDDGTEISVDSNDFVDDVEV